MSHGQTIPEHIKYAIDMHVSKGQKCGHFVTAVLENNLSEAVARADSESMANLEGIVRYCYNHIPSPCWGSKENVARWREQGGNGLPVGTDY